MGYFNITEERFDIMINFIGKQGGRIHLLRLEPGDLLLESIHEYTAQEGINNAYVPVGVATLSECVMHMVMTTGYPAVEHFERWEDSPLEVAGLSGVIVGGKAHLHMIVSNHEKAWAGHVEPGCRILYRCELVIHEIEDIEMVRGYDEMGNEVLCKP